MLAIAHPAWRAMIEGAVRDLTRRTTTIGGEHEDVSVAIFDIPFAIATIVELLYDARWLRPLRTLRRRRHRDVPALLRRHEHRERDPLAVRRPLEIVRRFR